MLTENSFRGRIIGIKCSNKDCQHKEPLPKKGDPEPGSSEEVAFAA